MYRNRAVVSSVQYGVDIIKWKKLVEKFCTDGEFIVEFFFPTESDRNSPSNTLIGAIFTDVKIACKTFTDMVDCNKCIIGRESKAMQSAFSDETSEESKTKTFTIRHDCATVENTHLLIKCMYEGWNEEMDKHAEELLILADCYDCDRIVRSATASLKRQLTLGRFWDTAAVAVLLQVQQPTLLEYCAKFADELPNGVYDVINRNDRGVDAEIAAVIIAVSALHKTKIKK